MADKKKVAKKPSKSVLDYDPLAWLGEEKEDISDVKPENSKKSATDNSGVKKSNTRKAATKKSVSKKAVTNNTETENMSNSTEESQGFGFFDDEPEEKESEQSQGYGFFDSSEPLTSQAAAVDRATNIIDLGAELTIRSVSTCKTLIDENLSNGFDIKLSAGELQKIDSAGLQLIYSLNKTLEKTSQSISWVSSNSIINDAAKLIGMPKLLESSDDEDAFGFFIENDNNDMLSDSKDDTSYGFF